MTTLYLVRHATYDNVSSVLSGRLPGRSLNAQGREEAARAAARLRDRDVTMVLSSPLERAMETAAPIAAGRGLAVRPAPELVEIDFGAWSGRSFDSLAGIPEWDDWNNQRHHARPPAGESMGEAQARVVALLDRLCREDASGAVLVSHGDVIKAAVLHVLGMPLQAYHRLDTDPASISTLELWPGGGKLVSLNERVGTGRSIADG